MSRSTRAARKVREAQQRSKMYSAAGPSLLDYIEDKLLDHCKRHYEMTLIPFGGNPPDSLIIKQERGIIHGLAIAVAKIRLPYEDQIETTKKVTKEFYRKAKDSHES